MSLLSVKLFIFQSSQESLGQFEQNLAEMFILWCCTQFWSICM